eukprot:Platyproteum_vivax@DN1478_c0_g1_i2.p1
MCNWKCYFGTSIARLVISLAVFVVLLVTSILMVQEGKTEPEEELAYGLGNQMVGPYVMALISAGCAGFSIWNSKRRLSRGLQVLGVVLDILSAVLLTIGFIICSVMLVDFMSNIGHGTCNKNGYTEIKTTNGCLYPPTKCLEDLKLTPHHKPIREMRWQYVKMLCANHPTTCGYHGRFCTYQDRFFFGTTMPIQDYKPPCIKQEHCQVSITKTKLNQDHWDEKEAEKAEPPSVKNEDLLRHLAHLIFTENFYIHLKSISRITVGAYVLLIVAYILSIIGACMATFGICCWRFGAKEDNELEEPFLPSDSNYGSTDIL